MERQYYNNDVITDYANEIGKGRNTKAIILALVILGIGIIGLLYAKKTFTDTTTPMYMFTTLSAYTVILIGVVKLIFFSSQLKYRASGAEVTKHSMYFKKEELNRILYAIETKDIALLRKIDAEEESGVRIDLFISKDCEFAACQVFDYIPYKYQAVSPVHRLDRSSGTALLEMIKNRLAVA